MVVRTNSVGSDKYVKNFALIASEAYPVPYTQGITITVIDIAGLRTGT